MKKLLLGLLMLIATTITFAQVAGTWKVAPQAGSLGVGPTQGDISWWSIDAAGIIQRDCFFDDRFVFNEDGSFNNVMDNWTWVEGWQGVAGDQCEVPVYPHDGSNAATWAYDEGAATLTLNGTGAHLGIPKAVNGMELTNPSQAPDSITYLVTEISATAMTIDISFGTGWWRFLLEKDAASGEDASLSDLQVDGATIPGFSSGITDYPYGLPEGTVDVPQITSATPTDPEVTSVVITQATAIPGDATVEVTSANGAVTMTYTVSYFISYDITLPVTFEDENIDYALTDFGGNVSEIIVDPTNAENMVAKSIKTVEAETWAGTTIGGTVGFANPVPFAEGATTMTVKVWSPDANTPVRLKVEDAGDVTITVETETNTTVGGDWETLTFDFANEAPGTEPIHFDWNYNKASIFFNFGTEGAIAGEKTYYWDDVEFGGGVEPKPLMAANVQDNFEDDGWGNITTWHFQDPDLVDITIIEDPTAPGNHILDYVRSGAFEYTNAQFILAHRMDLSERHNFEVRAYFPSSNDYSGNLSPTLALKLQNSLLGGEAWTTQTEVILTVDDFDQWVSLEFDFSAAADREDYDQIVVQFGGEGHLVPGQFHLDDLKLLGDPISILEPQTLQLEIYPNPANDVLNIPQFNKLIHLEMFNITGQKVMNLNSVPQQIQVGNLPEGVYMILSTGINGGQFTTKFVVQ